MAPKMHQFTNKTRMVYRFNTLALDPFFFHRAEEGFGLRGEDSLRLSLIYNTIVSKNSLMLGTEKLA